MFLFGVKALITIDNYIYPYCVYTKYDIKSKN